MHCMKDVMHIGSADDEIQCTAVFPVDPHALLPVDIVPWPHRVVEADCASSGKNAPSDGCAMEVSIFASRFTSFKYVRYQ